MTDEFIYTFYSVIHNDITSIILCRINNPEALTTGEE